MQSATCPLRLTVFISFLVIQNFLQKEKLIFLWCILTSFVHVCSVPYCFIRCFNWSWYRVGDNPLNYSSSKLSLPSCRCLVPLTHFLIAAETKQGNLSNKYFPFFFPYFISHCAFWAQKSCTLFCPLTVYCNR